MAKIDRRHFLSLAAAAAAFSPVPQAAAQALSFEGEPEEVLPGVWRFRLGTPERITPVATRRYAPSEAGLQALAGAGALPVPVSGEATGRGFLVRIPLAPNELVYGLGLQFQSFIQRGLKKMTRVNADPEMDSGDSHAPAPFYLSTRGYGVLVDTARYATFYLGNKPQKGEAPVQQGDAREAGAGAQSGTDLTQGGALPSAYGRFKFHEPSEAMVEIPWDPLESTCRHASLSIL